MNKSQILGRLQQLTGNLKPASETSSDQLTRLQQRLTEHLIRDSEFTVSGNRLHHEAAEDAEREAADSTEQFSHLKHLFEDPKLAERAGTSPLVFRRETDFRSNLLGNSVPVWGTGLAASESFGPFIDEHGIQVWFDFFLPVKLVEVHIKGSNKLALLIPLWGNLTARKTYKIEPGSVWIASDLIAKNSALQDYFTGLKVKGGSLELSANSEIIADDIFIKPNTTATLHLDLDQNPVKAHSKEAGIDASEASIELPKTFDLQFDPIKSSPSPSDASCTVFGCKAEFKYKKAAPIWVSGISQILIPYSVTTDARSSSSFQIKSSDSKLCNFAESAKIGSNSGWLLPAAKINPSQLGEAAGTGALCIGLLKGINARWKGLIGSRTKLGLPAIIVEPGLVTVVDFFAQNIYGKLRWVLWRNLNSPHHSDITLGFGKAFPFIFISSTNNTEAVFFFCSHKAAFDRPVDANGSPFKIESSIAFAGISQTGTRFLATLLDNDLLFDGNVNKLDAFERHSLILRNALFSVTRPFSLFLQGNLEDDNNITRGVNNITRGVVALMYGVFLYLPTLPDPYVASYTARSSRGEGGRLSNQVGMGIAGFVKWREREEVEQAEREDIDDPAYVYFRFAPLDQTIAFAPPPQAKVEFVAAEAGEQTPSVDFRAGVRTFNRDLGLNLATEEAKFPMLSLEQSTQTNVLRSTLDVGVQERASRAIGAGEIQSAIKDLEANPLFDHIKDKAAQVDQTLTSALSHAERGFAGENPAAFSPLPADRLARAATTPPRDVPNLLRAIDAFMLLDVSSNADQMGVSLGTALQVGRDERGDTTIRNVNALLSSGGPFAGSGMQLQILNMDVVATARNVRAVTLPQISWEPIINIPLEIEGSPEPLDLVTVAPGILVYENDGIPTRIFSESPYLVPLTPLSVTKHFLKEFHDKVTPRQLHSVFTLPFALLAQAEFNRKPHTPVDENTQLSFNMPQFKGVRGGLQIKALAPESPFPNQSHSFEGWTFQLDNLKWFLFGAPIPGSTLGLTVKEIFNGKFFNNQPQVPLEKIEFSGYGASIFSNWLNPDAVVADVSQSKFDVMVGRTAGEVIQVRSILFPFGVHVVRTITLTRSPSGYVFRSDSGWKAESDGFYDFDYKIKLQSGLVQVDDPYTFHPQPVKGVSNVREIKDFPDGGSFNSSFKINDPDLPANVLSFSVAKWKQLFKDVNNPDDSLKVHMQAVVFDADVHLDNVTSGGVFDPAYGDFKVQSRKMLGYVQLAPSSVLVPAHVFAELLKFQNGSLGGPVNCIIDVANSKQRMRLSRVDVNPALDNANKSIFATAARGSLILPPDGSWAVVKQETDAGDVKPVEEGQTVPLIKPNSSPTFKIANPADVVKAVSKINFGVLQSTGTQKLLFDIPQFAPNVKKLTSNATYFADAYKLLNSKGVFPNIANALALTNAEKEVEILGEGLMKMADRTLDLNSLLPSNYEYAFIDEPDILKIYVQYKSTGGAGGKLKLGIDSVAALADKWKAALSSIRVIVDLGPFKELMWVDGNFNASSGLNPKYDTPQLQFGPLLETVKDILRVLEALTGDDFDDGMKVGMSNSPDNWEYKFHCSQEIPVIKFPSPTQLSINPNPPLKLEAGLEVGFYFNEVVAIPTDLKQLVPACGAYVNFHGGIQVMCFSLAAASVYAVGQVDLGIAADSKAGISLRMKFGFGVELVVGLPVVGNVSVLYMMEITVGVSSAVIEVGAMMLFRGHAEICGGLVGVTIQIEAGGSIKRTGDETSCIAQVTFSIDIEILWVIDIEFSKTWQESRQIS
ncbi:MAG: hypothetical protein QOH25_2473 [Acidobacteriota bacterium]|jgi:hypothetical protein|nr:hypothetical protein [Acidobacteriota bacterium]